MAIAFDAITNPSYGGSAGTSKTFSHTCTGADRLLFVNVHTDSNVVTGVTYGGVAMTKIYGQSTDFYNTVWALVAPATGANNVVISCSSSVNIIPMAISYTGCDQNLPTIFATATDASSPQTVNATTVADNSWLMGYQRRTVGAGFSVGAGTTSRGNDATYAFATVDSGGALTPAGSYGLTVNYSGTSYLGVVAFAPVSASASKIKSADGLLLANIKSSNGVAIANIKSSSGVSNV
jgi:hypothetical protein